MAYLLALDQGTTSSRALVFDTRGALLATAQHEFAQYYPQPGWVEHDPELLWQSQLGAARQELAKAGIGGRDLLALGIANQRETTVVWERASGRPIHRAIVWQDRRTAAACDALKAQGLEALFRERTGLLLDPYFSGTKLAWILDAVPGARLRAERGELAFGTVDSWLMWRLTGGRLHATDVTNAARTLLFDIRTQRWDDTLLGHLRVPRGGAAAGVCLGGGFRQHGGALAGRAGAHLRRGRRSAGGPVRLGLHRPRHGQEHLRDRLFHAAAYRRADGRGAARFAEHRGRAG